MKLYTSPYYTPYSLKILSLTRLITKKNSKNKNLEETSNFNLLKIQYNYNKNIEKKIVPKLFKNNVPIYICYI